MIKNLDAIYLIAIKVAQGNNQTIGEKNDYYITLKQLEDIIYKIENE